MKSSTKYKLKEKATKMAAYTSEPSVACMASHKQDDWPTKS